MAWLWVVLFLVVFVVLAAKRASLLVWGVSYLILLALFTGLYQPSVVTTVVFWCVFIVLSLLLQVKPIRRTILSRPIMGIFRKVMPTMSDTEREALVAGNVSWEGDLFSGRPDWGKLNDKPMSRLTAEEQAFLDGPVEELCGMLNDWEISHRNFSVPDHVFDFIKKNGFFGMIIPKSYGGLEFGAFAHSQVIVKVATVSVSVATVISVPNSLGPAELLLHYGTDEQKNYYLPRLAKGEDIPCFALTSPHAGSDAAGSMRDHGTVCREVFEGQEQLCIRLTWSKRYITLCPIASILGLAFKLYDPEHLLSDEVERGITCALIPVQTPGVKTGRRHYPLTSAFPNGPTEGKDVVIPLSWVIGGQEQVGRGWTMLMECLAAGRAISLPSMAMGGTKKAMYTSGVYARVRSQFNVPIGAFDGIKAALATVGGYSFMMEAVRLFTLSDLDEGNQASVASAIAKSYTTEWSRQVVLAAMDIHGGKGICMGPKNYLAQGYIESPICITVEGANILTRSMIIFGQGVIRCHPYILHEMEACAEKGSEAVKTFDNVFFAHGGYLLSNFVRSFILGITGGRGVSVPRGPWRRQMQAMSRLSSVLGLVSDVAMVTLGGKLKRMERLSERLGALLGHLYSASAVIHYLNHNPNAELEPFAKWSYELLLTRAEENLIGFFDNYPRRILARFLKWWIFPLGRRHRLPRDREDALLAELMLTPSAARDKIVEVLFRRSGANNPIGDFDETLANVIAAAPLEKKLMQGLKAGKVQGFSYNEWVSSAVSNGILGVAEGEELQVMHKQRMAIIHVDDFSDDEVRHPGGGSS